MLGMQRLISVKKHKDLFKVIKRFAEKAQLIPCTLIPGDGVGPELCGAVLKLFKVLHVPVKFELFRLSELDLITSDSLDKVVDGVKRNRFCLRGVMATPRITPRGNVANVNLHFRKELQLFANVSHIKSIPGVVTRHKNINFYLIREQIEGEYSSLEHASIPGIVEHLKITTRQLTERIARFACKYASQRKRKLITIVHKANVMKKTDGLFLHTCKEVCKDYPELEIDDIIIDHCCMKMLTQPQAFDVILSPSLYGTILINIAAGLVGGCPFVTSSSFSTFDIRIFEPAARHAYLSATGMNIANPTAMILSASKLLNEMGLVGYGELLKRAVFNVLLEGKYRTQDIGGQHTTDEFTAAIISRVFVEKSKQIK